MSEYGTKIVVVETWKNCRSIPASELADAIESIPAEYLDNAELCVDVGMEYNCATVDEIVLKYDRPRTKEEAEADAREQLAYRERMEKLARERDYATYQALKARFGG